MHKCFCPPSSDSYSFLNGNHQASSSNGDSKVNNGAKDLQDTLVQKGSSSGRQTVPQRSPPSMLNGRNGSTKGESIYENSGTFLHGNKTPPPVPSRSNTPVPHPRTSLSVASSSSSSGMLAQESPKLLRNVRSEDTSSATLPSRGLGQGTENSSLSHKPSLVKSSPTAPSSPRVRGSSLQKRSPSPMRDQGQHISHVDVPQRQRTPEQTGSASLRELPPLSPYMSRRGSPGSQTLVSSLSTQGFTPKPVPESPKGHRKLTAPSKVETMRALYGQSPSAGAGQEKGPGHLWSGHGNNPISGLVGLPGSSPVASPHSQRRTSSSKEQHFTKPYVRERKNSISEISDNEDELLEYHRWQREERLREQEMEKLVSVQHLKMTREHKNRQLI